MFSYGNTVDNLQHTQECLSFFFPLPLNDCIQYSYHSSSAEMVKCFTRYNSQTAHPSNASYSSTEMIQVNCCLILKLIQYQQLFLIFQRNSLW